MNNALFQISCLLICGFLFGILCSAAFHVHTPEFAEQTKASCKNKGFYNIEENLYLKQKYDACGERLAETIVLADKNRAIFTNIINSIFFVEKLKRDYNTFAFDLNACKRFC